MQVSTVATCLAGGSEQYEMTKCKLLTSSTCQSHVTLLTLIFGHDILDYYNVV